MAIRKLAGRCRNIASKRGIFRKNTINIHVYLLQGKKETITRKHKLFLLLMITLNSHLYLSRNHQLGDHSMIIILSHFFFNDVYSFWSSFANNYIFQLSLFHLLIIYFSYLFLIMFICPYHLLLLMFILIYHYHSLITTFMLTQYFFLNHYNYIMTILKMVNITCILCIF